MGLQKYDLHTWWDSGPSINRAVSMRACVCMCVCVCVCVCVGGEGGGGGVDEMHGLMTSAYNQMGLNKCKLRTGVDASQLEAQRTQHRQSCARLGDHAHGRSEACHPSPHRRAGSPGPQ